MLVELFGFAAVFERAVEKIREISQIRSEIHSREVAEGVENVLGADERREMAVAFRYHEIFIGNHYRRGDVFDERVGRAAEILLEICVAHRLFRLALEKGPCEITARIVAARSAVELVGAACLANFRKRRGYRLFVPVWLLHVFGRICG